MPSSSRPAPALAGPSAATLARLFAGGLAGLLIWELWARVLTKAVLGYPLEPAGLIDGAVAAYLFERWQARAGA